MKKVYQLIDILQKSKRLTTEALRHRENQLKTPCLCVSVVHFGFLEASPSTYARGLMNC
jgi:hypothetical protein